MKRLCIPLCLALTSCATWAPVSYQEVCANRGMKLAGVSTYNGDGVAVGSNGGVASVSSNGEAISCVVPKDEAEACRINEMGRQAAPKISYNSGVRGRRLLGYYGYILLIVPGVLVKLSSDHALDKAMAASEEAARQPASLCQAKP